MIHYGTRYENQLKMLEQEAVKWKNELLRMFREKEEITSIHTKLVYVKMARKFVQATGVKDPKRITEKDTRKFYDFLKENHSFDTAIMFMNSLKSYLTWRNGNKTPKKIKWYKQPSRKQILRRRVVKGRDKILTQQEIEQLIKAAENPRAKAIIAVLYESAARLGEILSLRVRDVEFTSYGCKIRVVGKTGERTIPLIRSTPYLKIWLNMHPCPNNPDAPLWARVRKGEIGSITEVAVQELLLRCRKRAGIRKRVHPHILRHTRLTELARKLTEQELKIIAGWEKDSSMPSIYVHLSGRDGEEAILKAEGIKNEEEIKEDKHMEPLKCPRCQTINPFDAKFCYACGYILSEKIAIEINEVRELGDKIIEELLEDPEVEKAIKNALKRKLTQQKKKTGSTLL